MKKHLTAHKYEPTENMGIQDKWSGVFNDIQINRRMEDCSKTIQT